jgi:hypothetical protein
LTSGTNFQFGSTFGDKFMPNNPHEAKRTITRKDFGLFEDSFDHKHQSDWRDYLESKVKRVDGEFKHSYTN